MSAVRAPRRAAARRGARFDVMHRGAAEDMLRRHRDTRVRTRGKTSGKRAAPRKGAKPV